MVHANAARAHISNYSTQKFDSHYMYAPAVMGNALQRRQQKWCPQHSFIKPTVLLDIAHGSFLFMRMCKRELQHVE